jgi:hypothetical protein
VDYSVPVAELRAEFERYVKQHPLWSGEGMGLQVTDWSAEAMQLRCLVTCRNSSDGFNFGCDIREHMVTFVQQRYPQSFPTRRYLSCERKAEGEQAAQADGEPARNDVKAA